MGAADPETSGLRRRAAWLRGALLAVIFLSALSSGWALYAIGFYGGAAQGAGAESLAQAQARAAAIGGAVEIALSLSGFLAGLTAVLAYCFWTHRAARVAWSLDARIMTTTPDWAVGWHFVPVAHCWMPLLIQRRIWRATASGTAALPAAPPAALWIWWAAALLCALSALAVADDPPAQFGAFPERLYLDAAIDAVSAVCAAALLTVVRRVTQAQSGWDPAATFE